MSYEVIHGDCLEVLPTLADASVDAVVTDPPYGLAFMGKTWDHGVPGVAFWEAALRVAKPGCHLIAFGGTRTFHRLACAIEDAGWELRDTIGWLYGSGFPKGLNVVNQLAKLASCQSKERARVVVQCSTPIRVGCLAEKGRIAVALARILPEGDPALITETGGVVGLSAATDTLLSMLAERIGLNTPSSWNESSADLSDDPSRFITSTASETTTDQRTFDWLIGLHTSAITTLVSATLTNGSKWPAISAGGSLSGGSTSRSDILVVTALGSATWNPVAKWHGYNVNLKPAWEPVIVARKPLVGTVAANVMEFGCGAINIDGCRVPGTKPVVRAIDSDARNNPILHTRSATGTGEMTDTGRWPANIIHDGSDEVVGVFPGEAGGNGRASGPTKFGRHKSGSMAGAMNGTDDPAPFYGDSGSAARFFYTAKSSKSDRGEGNHHPTVKPIALMRYLCRLVTPPGGTVLDPFCGSGSTGVAAAHEGFNFIGIEREAEYVEIARKRIAAATDGLLL